MSLCPSPGSTWVLPGSLSSAGPRSCGDERRLWPRTLCSGTHTNMQTLFQGLLSSHRTPSSPAAAPGGKQGWRFLLQQCFLLEASTEGQGRGSSLYHVPAGLKQPASFTWASLLANIVFCRDINSPQPWGSLCAPCTVGMTLPAGRMGAVVCAQSTRGDGATGKDQGLGDVPCFGIWEAVVTWWQHTLPT